MRKVYIINKDKKIVGTNDVSIVEAIDPQNQSLKLCAKIIELKDENKIDQDRENVVLSILQASNFRNIVRIYQFYDIGTKRYIIMERCDMTLQQYINEIKQKQKQLTVRDFLNIVYQVCQGCKFLQQKNILHRDIKPVNILVNVNQEGQPTFKIADFDISIALDAHKLSTYNMKGTNCYKAPEIENSEYSHYADVYAFGISLLQLFGEISPNTKIKFEDRLKKHQSLEAIKNSQEEVDKQLIQKLGYVRFNQVIQNFFNKMLQYKPENRGDWQQISKDCFNLLIRATSNEYSFQPILQNEFTRTHQIQFTRNLLQHNLNIQTFFHVNQNHQTTQAFGQKKVPFQFQKNEQQSVFEQQQQNIQTNQNNPAQALQNNTFQCQKQGFTAQNPVNFNQQNQLQQQINNFNFQQLGLNFEKSLNQNISHQSQLPVKSKFKVEFQVSPAKSNQQAQSYENLQSNSSTQISFKKTPHFNKPTPTNQLIQPNQPVQSNLPTQSNQLSQQPPTQINNQKTFSQQVKPAITTKIKMQLNIQAPPEINYIQPNIQQTQQRTPQKVPFKLLRQQAHAFVKVQYNNIYMRQF